MADGEQDYPIIPHESITGHSFVQVRGNEADITCNECGAVIRTVLAQEAAAVMEALMMEVVAGAICSARCPHCGALNTFPRFSAIDAFVCSECGEGVAAEKLVQ